MFFSLSPSFRLFFFALSPSLSLCIISPPSRIHILFLCGSLSFSGLSPSCLNGFVKSEVIQEMLMGTDCFPVLVNSLIAPQSLLIHVSKHSASSPHPIQPSYSRAFITAKESLSKQALQLSMLQKKRGKLALIHTLYL